MFINMINIKLKSDIIIIYSSALTEGIALLLASPALAQS